jgi:hypothetical protein
MYEEDDSTEIASADGLNLAADCLFVIAEVIKTDHLLGGIFIVVIQIKNWVAATHGERDIVR